jgi:hypothetical protein
MATARVGHTPLLVWHLQLQVGEDVDDIIVILCLYFRSPSAAEMYLLLSCFLVGRTAAEKIKAMQDSDGEAAATPTS